MTRASRPAIALLASLSCTPPDAIPSWPAEDLPADLPTALWVDATDELLGPTTTPICQSTPSSGRSTSRSKLAPVSALNSDCTRAAR